MKNLLYKLQLCGYINEDFFKIADKQTTGEIKVTQRIKRLKVMTLFLCVLGFGLPLLFPVRTLAFANTLLNPVENAIKKKFLRKAQNKLRKMPNLIKIGITGSYGKTSVKNILLAILSVKYKTVASPESFNTPMGFAKTVNDFLPADTQILIMEMGARRVGEIREMCDLLHPNHGIITSIGECHMKTFGTMENIQNTKEELFQSLPFNATAITDGDNQLCRQLWHPNKTEVVFEKETFETNLLGRHNQKNILLCVAMARALGVGDAEIKRAVAGLKPTPHRLELIKSPNGIKILDDSYNSNPQSAKVALEVLADFTGGKKVVQTAGFVEQGENTIKAHMDFAKEIAKVADAVIFVGELNKSLLMRGISGFSGEVFFADSRESAKKIYPQILKSGDILLIENDLPENY